MKIVYIILAILGLLLAIIVGGAMLYAIIVFRHDHRHAKIRSDKYDMYNDEREKSRTE